MDHMIVVTIMIDWSIKDWKHNYYFVHIVDINSKLETISTIWKDKAKLLVWMAENIYLMEHDYVE